MNNLEIKPTVLVVEDDQVLLNAIVETLQMEKYEVVSAKNGKEAEERLVDHSIDIVLTDVNMPEVDGITLLRNIKKIKPLLPVIMMSAYGSVQKAVQAIKKGALDYIAKPFSCDELKRKIEYYVERTVTERQFDVDSKGQYSPVVEDPSSIELLNLSKRVAQSNSSILIAGESGTGKEVLARFIHEQSPRAKEKFVAINCAAIPDNMLEAILFGHEKGAFTGAHQSTPGKFEQANGGTVLLDEISEMELGLQAKLLRVLQEREVERIGGKKVIPLDVRVIATTNRQLHDYVCQGKFREDLYYRLNVFPLQWLPLRERRGDIVPLAKHLLRKHSDAQQLGEHYFDESAINRLESHDWPGNVRELENVVQRSLILANGAAISDSEIYLEAFDKTVLETEGSGTNISRHNNRIEDSVQKNVGGNEVDDNNGNGVVSLGEDLQMREFEVIVKTLREVNGRRKSAAEKLGISPRTLRYKLARMRESGIQFETA